MKISPRDTDSFVNKLEPFKNPILLYGPDEGMVFYRTNKIIHNFLGGGKKTDAVKSTSWKENKSKNKLGGISNKSLFNNKEVLRFYDIDEKIIEFLGSIDLNDKNLLIILNASELAPRSKIRQHFEKEKNFAIIACYKPDLIQIRKTIIGFAQKNNLKIENDAIEYLLESLGTNYQIVLNELEKILLIDQKIIKRDMLLKLLSSNSSFVFEDLIFDCLVGKKSFIEKGFYENVQDISDAIVLLANIKNMLIILGKAINFYNEEKNLEAVIQNYMPRYLFKKRGLFESIVKKTNKNKIVYSLEKIEEIELKLRTDQQLYKIILLRGMLNISQKMK